ncbi:MAG: PorV/PorQ family protein [Elusimicrobia bacterium]|nr:PorV/PorQ family protein [Elusimicrobiota bacterium]
MKKFILTILSLTIFSILAADSFVVAESPGTSTAVFLKLIPGARPAGMGNAFTAISDDSNAIYTNSSGLIQIKSINISATHILLFEDITHTSVNLAYPSGANTFGLGISYLSTGEIEARDSTGLLLATNNSVSNSVISVAYTRKIVDNFGVGLTAKTISQKYGLYSGNGMATDVSGIYKFRISEGYVSAGLALQNLGSPITIADVGNSLPTITRLGIAYIPSSRFKIDVDADKTSDSAMKIYSGIEYIYNNSFVLRAGHNQLNKISGTEGICLGIGTRTNLEKEALWEEGTVEESKEEGSEFDFDYALTSNSEDLGYTHRISVTYKFGNKFH